MDHTAGVKRRGQAGGRALHAKYGVEHLRTLGRKGGAATVARHGRAHMQRIGRKGFAVTVEPISCHARLWEH